MEVAIFALIAVGLGLAWTEWRIWTAYLANREESFLWAVRTAVTHDIPLPDALYAIAPTFRGKYGGKVLALATLLERGFSLPDALAATPGVVSDSSRLLLSAGRSEGALRDLVPQAVELQAARRTVADSIVGRLAYLGFLALMLANVAAFLSYYIAPKFKAIWSDFGLELPEATRLLVFAEDSFLDALVGAFLLFCVIGLALIAFRWLAGILGMATFDHAAPGRMLIRSRSSETLRGLGALLGDGRPVVQSLNDLERYVGPSAWSRRLEKARLVIGGGQPLSTALTRARLISKPDAAVLAAAEKLGNLPWAMRQLALAKDRRATYRVRLLLDACYPWVVAALGCIYGLIAVAYFAPLVKLIEEVR